MCTKSRAVTLGCDVNGSYDGNQLVKYSDLSKSIVEIYFYIEWIDSSSLGWYRDSSVELLTTIKLSYSYTKIVDNDGNPTTFEDYKMISGSTTSGSLYTQVSLDENDDYWSITDISPSEYLNQRYLY